MKITAPLVAPLCPALVALALVALRAAVLSLAQLQLPAPVVPAADATGASPAPRARVMVVVIDGLRADVAAELPFVRELGGRGARAELTAEVPVFSSAQYVSMLTGVPPRDSGVRTNVDLTRTPLDNVARRLRADSRRSVEIGDQVDWWRTLFGDDLSVTRLTSPAALPDEAIALMPGADLMIVHLCDVDRAGHDAGASSPAYREASRVADASTRRLAAAWGWPATNVVVLADHGHMWRGGHGGDEPDVRRSFFVAGGPAVAPGASRAGMRMIDVAPTLAAMLGVAAPATAEGRAWLDALALPAATRAALATDDEARAGKTLTAAAAARASLRGAELHGRGLRLGGCIAVLALVVLAVRGAPRAARLGLACGTGAFALTAIAFAVRHGLPSFSADRSSERLAYATGLIATGACVIAFAPAFAAVVRPRRRLSAAATAAVAIAATVGAAPGAIAAFIAAGAFAPRLTCEPGWLAALPLIAYTAFVPAALAAALLVGVAVAIEAITSVASGRGPGR